MAVDAARAVAVLALAALVAAAVAGALPAAAAAAVAGLALAAAAGAAALVWRRRASRLGHRLRAAEQRLSALEVHDDVTGCLTLHGLALLGDHTLQVVRRRGDSAHALLVEVGGLDVVERASGRRGADVVLTAVADALCAATRTTDTVARWSTDTFAVVGPGSGTVPGEVERRVRVRLVEDPPVDPAHWPGRVTAGGAILEPWDPGTLRDLLHRAEQDLSLRRALRAPSAPEPPRPQHR